MRRWWRWINASPANLAVVRLGIEAAALDATVSGLPGDGARRPDRLVAGEHRAAPGRRGHGPRQAAVEASLVKAMFTGLVVDLLATGERRRLTRSLEAGVARLERQLAHPRCLTSSECLR